MEKDSLVHLTCYDPSDLWSLIFIRIIPKEHTLKNITKMKKWLLQWTQFMQLRKEAWKKIQDFNEVWTCDLARPVWCSTNWAMKPLAKGAGQFWVHIFPWKKWVLMIYKINHIIWTEMKWKWRNDRRSERNLCNCVKKPEKKFRTSMGFEPVTSRYQCDALPTELWRHWRWEQVNCLFVRCLTLGVWYQKSDVRCLISEVWCQPSVVRRLMSGRLISDALFQCLISDVCC